MCDKIKFTNKNHEKYDTSSIYIRNVSLSLKDCEIVEITETEYGYEKAIVKLSDEKIEKMEEIEKCVNDHLEKEKLNSIKLVYGNKIYAKKNPATSEKCLKQIKLKSIFINSEKRQLFNSG